MINVLFVQKKETLMPFNIIDLHELNYEHTIHEENILRNVLHRYCVFLCNVVASSNEHVCGS